MTRNPKLYLEDIFESLTFIKEYTATCTEEEFLQNQMLQDAVVRRIEIIGEAANRVSKDFRKEHTNIPWREMVAMRNIIVHEYFGIDLERVWTVAKKNVPELQQLLETLD